jgi:hypothetical protein
MYSTDSRYCKILKYIWRTVMYTVEFVKNVQTYSYVQFTVQSFTQKHFRAAGIFTVQYCKCVQTSTVMMYSTVVCLNIYSTVLYCSKLCLCFGTVPGTVPSECVLVKDRYITIVLYVLEQTCSNSFDRVRTGTGQSYVVTFGTMLYELVRKKLVRTDFYQFVHTHTRDYFYYLV